MALEDSRLGAATGQSEVGQTEGFRARERTERHQGGGDTSSHLLERVGGPHSSSLSGLLTRIDYKPRAADGEGSSGLRDQLHSSCQAGPCVSDAVSSLPLVGASSKHTERSHRDSSEPNCSTPVFSSVESPDTRRRRTSPSDSPVRKRKSTYLSGDGVGGEIRVRGKEGSGRQQENLHSSLYSVLLETLPKVTGVFFDKSQERWVSSVYMGGRNIKSYFPVYKHGFLQARNMAISQRLSQVAHKGVSRTEMDSLTPAGLTLEALAEVLRYKGALPNESATAAATAPAQKNRSTSISAELQADATAEQPKSQHASPSFSSHSSELQHPKLDTKGSGESLRLALLLPRSGSSLSWNSLSSPLTLGTSSGDRCGNSSTVSSVYHHEPSDERCTETGSRGLFSTLHSYAAFEFSPWEKGITWNPETISWAVHSALRRECVVYVPVRTEEKHKEIIDAVGEWLSKAGDIRMRAKFALELTHIGRALANKTQVDEAQRTDLHATCVGDALGVKEEQQQPCEAPEERQHGDEASSSVSGTRSLPQTDANKETEQQPSQRSSSASDGGNRLHLHTLECERPSLTHGEGEGTARDALEKAAEAIFRAVGEAHAEALVLLRRLNEVRSDDELIAALKSMPEKGDEGKSAGGGVSSSGLALALQELSSKEESTSTGDSQDSAARADDLLRRSFASREGGGGALKLWAPGVSWAASNPKCFAVGRLACGSCTSRGGRSSSKRGYKEPYCLACESLKSTAENMGVVGLMEETGVPLLPSSASASQNQQEGPLNCEREAVFESAGSSSEQQQRSSKSTSSGVANGEVVSPQSLPNLLQQRVLLESPLPRADKSLRVAVEGASAKSSGSSSGSSHPARCSSSSSSSSNRSAFSEADGAAIARLTAGGLDPTSLEAERKMMLQQLDIQRRDRVNEEQHNGQMGSGLRRVHQACLAAPHIINQEYPAAEEDEAQLQRLQWQVVRRCLVDLRERSTSLFVPHVGEQKAAVVDTHLSLVSTCVDLHEILVYVRLFESALLEGQLPSQMSEETQRVFFGALDALAEARKLHNS
ncbi:hypothetical protein Emed_007004 [Eimeria media]